MVVTARRTMRAHAVVYSAFARCSCGAGLVKMGKLWTCSSVAFDEPGSTLVRHDRPLHVDLYEIKAEAGGRTTRPRE
jgi:hypothetical protein